MLLHHVYYEASQTGAKAVRRPSWAPTHTPVSAAPKRGGPRRALGQALISLGRMIAAEPAQVGPVASLGRQ